MKKRVPKEIWLVFDPMDGPHIFESLKACKKTLAKWHRTAKDDRYDSYWDMVGPVKYIASRESY